MIYQKFRGKRIDNGEFVYGWVLNVCRDFSIIYDTQSQKYRKVYSESVALSTGLFDKNGDEIFENDYVQVGDDKNFYFCRVSYDAGSADFCLINDWLDDFTSVSKFKDIELVKNMSGIKQ
ncbi:YopX family protein [Campylobacter curvus]|uniref:YopX family protein n=1 Tax=Campylobacter curvus TaxID=200 RepID=UPI00146FCB16|nr:YopX family protein [Campylobacter curvus]